MKDSDRLIFLCLVPYVLCIMRYARVRAPALTIIFTDNRPLIITSENR